MPTIAGVSLHTASHFDGLKTDLAGPQRRLQTPLKFARPVRVTQKVIEVQHAQQFTPEAIVAIQDVMCQYYAHQASFQAACYQLSGSGATI
jgi:hypothetical protein